MKKIYMFIVLALFLAGCTDEESNEKANDNKNVTDTIAQNQVSIEEADFVEELPVSELITSDLAFVELKGPVKKMIDNYENIYEFDESGILKLVNGQDPFDEEYNKSLWENGLMEEYFLYERNEEGNIGVVNVFYSDHNYFWENGRVVKITGSNEGLDFSTIKEYDELGELVRTIDTEKYDFEDEIETDICTYQILKRDRHDNWIERKVIHDSDDWEVEKRTIIYYGEEDDDDSMIESSIDPDRVTPDLSFFELRGPVKTMSSEFGSVYEFDRSGSLVLLNGNNPFSEEMEDDSQGEHSRFWRNEEGYIEKVLYDGSIDEYYWKDGRVVESYWGVNGDEEEWYWNTVYIYNNEGELTRTELYSDAEGERYLWYNYEVLKKDDYGNWIERNVSSMTENKVEKRTITYYK